jgi:hypothetical protein
VSAREPIADADEALRVIQDAALKNGHGFGPFTHETLRRLLADGTLIVTRPRVDPDEDAKALREAYVQITGGSGWEDSPTQDAWRAVAAAARERFACKEAHTQHDPQCYCLNGGDCFCSCDRLAEEQLDRAFEENRRKNTSAPVAASVAPDPACVEAMTKELRAADKPWATLRDMARALHAGGWCAKCAKGGTP